MQPSKPRAATITTAGGQRSFEEKLDDLAALTGQRVRITWPNGADCTGVVSVGKVGVHRVVRVGRRMIDGAVERAVRVERMVRGRYQAAECSSQWGPPLPQRGQERVPANVLEHVRGMFPLGATIECVENTYRPELNGSTRRVTRAGRSKLRVEILTGPGAGNAGFEMALPANASDVLELTDDTVKFRLGRGGHTATFRALTGG
jgi:hypothetical protein